MKIIENPGGNQRIANEIVRLKNSLFVTVQRIGVQDKKKP